MMPLENPRHLEILGDAQKVEEQGKEWWRYYDVGAHPGYLTALVALGCLEVKRRSKGNWYRLTEKGKRYLS